MSKTDGFLGFEKIPANLRVNFSTSTNADLASFPADWPETLYVPFAVPYVPVADDRMYATMTVTITAPLSRGNMSIKSANSRDNPIISPNWLQSTTDQQVAVQAFKRARQIFLAAGITNGSEIAPGPSIQTDAEILDYLREAVVPIYHATASCKTFPPTIQSSDTQCLFSLGAMGIRDNPDTVVDSNARVVGVSGLRVVDASAFPFTPPGLPQASVCKYCIISLGSREPP